MMPMFQKLLSYLRGIFDTSKTPVICHNTLGWIEQNPQHAKVLLHIAEGYTPAYPEFEEISGKQVKLASDQYVMPTYNRFVAVIAQAEIHTSSGYIKLPRYRSVKWNTPVCWEAY